MPRMFLALRETIVNAVEKVPVLLELTSGGKTGNREVDTSTHK